MVRVGCEGGLLSFRFWFSYSLKFLFAGGWYKLQLIPHARVPILKIENIQHNISCDISIDNLVGQMKSKILLWLNEIDGRFHDMVLLVCSFSIVKLVDSLCEKCFNVIILSSFV